MAKAQYKASIIEQPTRSLDAAQRNRGITVENQTGHSPARIFEMKDGQGCSQGVIHDN